MTIWLVLAATASALNPCLAEVHDSQSDWRQCMVDYNERLNLELEQAWRKAVDSAQDEDEMRKSGYHDSKGQTGRLREAQIAWNRFRSNQCDAEAYRMFGGTGAVGVEQSCLARMTRQRIEELRTFTSEN